MQPDNGKKKSTIGPGFIILGSIIFIFFAIMTFVMTGNTRSASDQSAIAQSTTECNAAMQSVHDGNFKDAEARLEPFVGTATPEAETCARTLAGIYALEGKMSDAERICTILGGKTKQGTSMKLRSLAVPMVETNPKVAKALMVRAGETYGVKDGQLQFDYAEDLYNIALCDEKLGDKEAAVAGLDHCIRIFETGHAGDADIAKSARQALSRLAPRSNQT